jgi:hypothetical protein
VTQCDPVRPAAPDEIVKKFTTRTARSLLQIPSRQIPGGAMKFQPEIAGHGRDEAFVFLGIFAPQSVIDVRNSGNPDSQFQEGMQETDRVRAARDRDNHAGTMGTQHVVTRNGRGYLLQHAPIMPWRPGRDRSAFLDLDSAA